MYIISLKYSKNPHMAEIVLISQTEKLSLKGVQSLL